MSAPNHKQKRTRAPKSSDTFPALVPTKEADPPPLVNNSAAQLPKVKKIGNSHHCPAQFATPFAHFKRTACTCAYITRCLSCVLQPFLHPVHFPGPMMRCKDTRKPPTPAISEPTLQIDSGDLTDKSPPKEMVANPVQVHPDYDRTGPHNLN